MIAYLEEVTDAPDTPVGLTEINPVASGLATLVVAGLLLVGLRAVMRSTPDDADDGVRGSR